ncbi:MAG: hypothetical protein JOZ54_08950 [Acidobacteria bacterium]|nr:hypothetical protein [Acidobacteriota bacterium]
MLAHGLDARGPLRSVLGAIVAPLVAVFLLRPVLDRIARDARLREWALWALAGALVSGLWIALVDPFQSIAVLFLPPVAFAAIGAVSRRDVGFTRDDVGLLAIALALVASLGLVLPLALAAPLAALVTLGLRVAVRFHVPRVLYPLFAFAMFFPTTTPVVNLFEEGHSLTPAAEMLRGERPYRDIVPGHGLLSDGLLDATVIRLGARDIGDVLRVRNIVAALVPVAVYCLALGVTGSANVALLALLFSASLTITGTPWARPISAIASMPGIRPIPSLFALAFCAAAIRLRRPRWLGYATALAVLAVMTSLDFGFYAVVAVGVTAILMRSWRAPLVGGGIATAIVALPMLATGCFVPFVRTTLFELTPLGEAYAVAFFGFPPSHLALRGFPEIVGGIASQRVVWIVLWFGIAAATAVALALRLPRRLAALLPLGVWTMAAGISYAERTNVYFLPVAAVLVIGAANAMRRTRWFAAVVVALVVIAAPTSALRDFFDARKAAPPSPQILMHGALFDADNVAKIAAAEAFIDRSLKPGETWFDFANMPALYYLFDRNCPIRQYEIAFYEPEALQREVIARLERDQTVRAVLMQFPNLGYTSLDIPNASRAPLVHAWLRAHFAPAYEREGVVFWVRVR